MRVRRILAVAGMTTVAGVAMAPAAQAVIDPPNTIGCTGEAVIVSNDAHPSGGDPASLTAAKALVGQKGVYEIKATDSTAKFPRDGKAYYQGSTAVAVTEDDGEVVVHVGWLEIKAGTWSGHNGSHATTKTGVKDLPAALKYIPPGKYDITGFHEGVQGRCSGHITIDVQGTPFDNPTGLVAIGGLVISMAALTLAAKAKG